MMSKQTRTGAYFLVFLASLLAGGCSMTFYGLNDPPKTPTAPPLAPRVAQCNTAPPAAGQAPGQLVKKQVAPIPAARPTEAQPPEPSPMAKTLTPPPLTSGQPDSSAGPKGVVLAPAAQPATPASPEVPTSPASNEAVKN
jgi:hypothetical protein